MSTLLAALLLALPSGLSASPSRASDDGPSAAELAGTWRAALTSPGGALPFGLELEAREDGLAATVRNGEERIEVPHVTLADGALGLHFDHYDSRILAHFDPDSGALVGTWRKRAGAERWAELPFSARRGEGPRFPRSGAETDAPALRELLPTDGAPLRWRAHFESSEDPAVLLLARSGEGPDAVEGTFLTTTGDYRFLAGVARGPRLALSCFDGAHAFLFRAELEDGRLTGDFWSRDSWHETWTATPDADVRLPDAFGASAWQSGASLVDLVFLDLEGRPRSLAEPAFAGHARLLQVFGTWCPNCYDETRYLVELHRRYAERGLAIQGLAFELTGDFARDAEQVRVHREHHGIEYPLLVAGLADKARASAAFPALDRVRSYPTTIFLGADGTVREVHTGFTGPGTGEAYEELRRRFESTIEELLAEPVPTHDESWAWLAASTWVERGAFAGAAYTFHEDEDGARRVTVETHGRSGTTGREVLPVSFQPGALALGDSLWRVERRAGVLVAAFDPGRRLSPDPRTDAPLLARLGIEEPDELVRALRDDDALVRREAVRALASLRRRTHRIGLPEALPLLEDESFEVRTAAAWALGHALEGSAAGALAAALDERHVPLRRAAARSLALLARREPELSESWSEREPDPDPLVRAALEGR